MKKILALMIGVAWCATAIAQTGMNTPPAAPAAAPTPTPAEAAAKKAADRKAKQQMVQSTTQAADPQASQTPLKGAKPPSQKSTKLTTEQRKETMKGAMGNSTTGASSQYGASAAAASAKVDPNAPKVAKPNMADPKTQEAMQKASKQ